MRLRHSYIIALMLCVSSSVCGKQVVQGQGHVKMNGQILASACSLHIEDVWQEIEFVPVQIRDIYSQEMLQEREFSLRLVNCQLDREDDERWYSVAVTFSGEKDKVNHSLFALQGEAEGVALQVVDGNGNAATPGNVINSVPLKEEDNQLYYHLRIMRNGLPLKEGEWKGTVRFMVTYE